MRPLVGLLVVVLLVTALPAAVVGDVGAARGAPDVVTGSSGASGAPTNDTVGYWNGYWHNDSIEVDQSDGLSDGELEAYVSRAMARVEYLRDRPFKEQVSVEVISREDYQQRTENRTRGENFSAWNNQVWEALLIVGEDRDVTEELQTVFGTAVAGFYSPGDDEIKIITETPDRPVLDNATLIHELVHAMQDQYYNISQGKYQGETQDGQLAADGLLEGEANYIEARYSQRCGDEWACVATPQQERNGGEQPNLGILLTVINPYSDGPVYIHSLVNRDGWAAVDAAFEDPPASSEQIIHLTDEEPAAIEYEDEATNGWRLFPGQGVNGSDTVGEASIYAMFWYQARQYGANTVDPRSLFEGVGGPYDTYNYSAGPSAGWGNDRVFPYRKGRGNDTQYGYVWVTEWDTSADAEEFRDTYLNVFDAHGAEQVGARTWVIEDGPYADAFRVARNGTRVVIVNGPAVEDLADIRPSVADPGTPNPTQSPTPNPTPSPTPNERSPETTPEETTRPDEPTPTITGSGGPGFGVALAVVALGAAALLARRIR